MLKTRQLDTFLGSRLFNQDTFYRAFTDDLKNAQREVIIESPFITSKRIVMLIPVFRTLTNKGVRIIINTKPPDELEPFFSEQAKVAIAELQSLDVLVLLTIGHHRKLSIIDRSIFWEGSLNILSQSDSCEMMRRVHSSFLAEELVSFLRLDKFLR